MYEINNQKSNKSLTHAMDEIYSLRATMADCANQLEGLLELRTLSQVRRKALEQEIVRLRACARGEWKETPISTRYGVHYALESAGASSFLNVDSWEKEWKYKV